MVRKRNQFKPKLFEKKKYSDPLDVAPTINPVKLVRRWRKKRAQKKK